MRNKIAIAFLVIISSFAVFGSDGGVDIERKIHLNVPPDEAATDKSVSLSFEGSPKMTKILQEKLRLNGVPVAENDSEHQLRFKITGIYRVSGAGREASSGSLGDLFESTVSVHAGDKDFRVQNVSTAQILVSGAITGFISISDMLIWASQKMGIAGRFNDVLTGDPRGFCWHPNCSQYTNMIVIRVSGNGYHWWIQETAKSDKIVLDVLMADALENAISPILKLGKDVGQSDRSLRSSP